MVTSRKRTAVFVQLAGAVMASVGVSVIASVGVNVAGTKPAFVGGRVDVIKFGGIGVFASSICTEIQADKKSVNKRIDFLNMELHEWGKCTIYTQVGTKHVCTCLRIHFPLKHHHLPFGFFDRVTGDLLFKSLARQYRNFEQAAQ